MDLVSLHEPTGRMEAFFNRHWLSNPHTHIHHTFGSVGTTFVGTGLLFFFSFFEQQNFWDWQPCSYHWPHGNSWPANLPLTCIILMTLPVYSYRRTRLHWAISIPSSATDVAMSILLSPLFLKESRTPFWLGRVIPRMESAGDMEHLNKYY